MKTLINAVEEWVDLRIFASSKNAYFEAKFNEMEEIHIRDANRIAELERRVMSLDARLESVEGEVDIEEIAQNVHDNVERFIIDAVRTEIDAIDFKVTVDR